MPRSTCLACSKPGRTQRPCTGQEVGHMVDIRMKRQNLLRRDDPPHIWAVMDEAVIRRMVRGGHTMREQLRHLLECTTSPHVTVQILPFSSGAHAAALGSFLILGGPTPSLDVVYVDVLGGSLFMEKPKELERYRLAFEYLRAQALDLEKTEDLIHAAIKEL